VRLKYCYYRSAGSPTSSRFASRTNSRTLSPRSRVERVDLTVLPGLEFFRRAYKLARLVSGSLASRFAPYPRSKLVLERGIQLFFPVFSHTYELYSLATIPNWRQRCRKAASFINEVSSDPSAGISARALISL